LRKIAYASVVNAYWSPFADIIYPIPDLPITRVLGVRLAQKLFNIIRPAVFALHATPLNRVRHRFGLPSLEGDLRSTYTWGDYTLYTDISDVIPTHNLPAHHYYLGPVLWSTHTSLPEWWNHVPEEKPIVFLTLGSSGQADLLPMVLNALSRLPVTTIVATAGKVKLAATPANAFIADYLPMNIATERSQLVICNGGSLATYHALAIGVPVIGLCSNMDQLLNMEALKRIGAGITLRAAQTNIAELIKAVTSALYNLSYRQAAKKVAKLLMQHDSGRCFREIVMGIISPK
jgi:UDP:flavonoid glycosyltransferase YjiC (YdhE family)